MRSECPSCGKSAVWFGRYDRFGCLGCDQWTEGDHCVGAECDAGFDHAPDKPSLVNAEKDR